jgi:hypothetical protein
MEKISWTDHVRNEVLLKSPGADEYPYLLSYSMEQSPS